MARLISHLLWLMALLLAPVPAVAVQQPAKAMTAAADHCDEGDASKSDHHDDQSQQDGEGDGPCCKDMGHCYPAAVPFSAQGTQRHSQVSTPTHGAWAEIFMSGTAGPPLTEPPTIA
jgi:hypothetical protein